MGYTSDVRSIIYGHPDNVQALVTKHALWGRDVATLFGGAVRRYKSMVEDRSLNPRERTTEVEMLDLALVGVRWDEAFPDVNSWTMFVADAPVFFLNYELVRIGEDVDDIETRSGGSGFDADTMLRTVRIIVDDIIEI